MESMSLCTRWKEPNEALDESDYLNFYNNMKCVVWYILITTKEKKKRLHRVCTGVTLNEDGYIVTSSICLNYNSDIQVRGVGEGNAFIKAKVVEIVKDFGLAILKVDMTSQYAEIGNGMNLKDGIRVYSISHPTKVMRHSILVGRVISELSGKEVLDVYDPKLKEYCTMLRSDLQFIQIKGFNSHWTSFESIRLGCEIFGAPVFNSNGQVVGVIVSCENGIDYAIPSIYLKQILENFLLRIQGTSKGKSSRTSKRKSRGKSSRGGISHRA